MRKLISILVLLVLLNIGGCGGGGSSDSTCDFDFNSFLNGPNAQQADSQWDCINSADEVSSFQAFEDGAGFSSIIGPFTYERIGCRSASVDSAAGSSVVNNIDGSIESGILTFTQTFDADGTFDVGCVLVVF